MFLFLIRITKMNVIEAWVNVFTHADPGTLHLHKTLTDELINNPYLMEESTQEAGREHNSACGTGHTLMALPPFARFEALRSSNPEQNIRRGSALFAKEKAGSTVVAL